MDNKTNESKLNGAEAMQNQEGQNCGKWDELIGIMNELSDCRAHFVMLLARLYLDMERRGK